MVYLGLGTNLGNKEQNLRMSVQKIEERIGEIVSLSAFYVTAPWGFASDNSFLNAVVCVETPLRPLEILKETQAIERELGRTSKSVGGVYSDRLIDIDLLLCGDIIMDEEEDKKSTYFVGIHRSNDRNLLCHLHTDAQAIYRATLFICSINRMHRLSASVYCGEKEEVKSSFIVL